MWRLLKYAALLVVLILVVVATAVGLNTALIGSRQIAVLAVTPEPVDEQNAAQRLAAAVRFQTIANFLAPDQNADQFTALHAHLERSFPNAHRTLKREAVGSYSLLYTWEGSDPSAAPILLLAHQDVVPVAPGTEGDWEAPPFDGLIRDGFVWGRGAWDNKGNLYSIMEAVEALAAQGLRPRRTIYLAFGHDEEVSGRRGAKAIAELLAARNVRLAFVLDEGLLVMERALPGLEKPAALIGVAEKGYVTLLLQLSTTPGHSSMPPRRSAIGMMSAALARLEDRSFPPALRGVARDMFETLAPEMQGINRVLFSNLWLFRPLVQRELARSASSDAMLRTTTALTIVSAGNKDNVLPGRAEATVNFRLLPGDTQASVIAHTRGAIDDGGITIKPDSFNSEPSPVTPMQSEGYAMLARTIREVFPETVVAPGLMIAATDSRHFIGIADNIFRFSPVRATPQDLTRFHGTNERIAIENYAEMIRFYRRLIRNAAGL
ncbi:MAG: carboxypeptidase [Hyphomicrobiales bacterium]|jgi:carboxypeptidase PM20D1|nr:carboxypeptidase [Hyphomicrobiales bacterium]